MKKDLEIIIKLIVSFLIIQLLGLYVGAKYAEAGVSITENPDDVVNAGVLLTYVIGGAVFMLILIKLIKKRWVFLILEGLVIFTSSFLVANAFVDELLSLLFSAGILVGRHLHNNFKIFATAMACAGVGALMGNSLGILPAALFALGLSVYDVIAVFGTKHMITMAKDFSQKDLAFSLKIGNKSIAKGSERTGVELGTGDIVVPTMLAVSFYIDSMSFMKGYGAILGATVGLLVVLHIVMQKHSYLPALPPIVLFSLIGGLLL